MAEHDSDPLSAEERAELEQLRAEKAARAAKEQARRERTELEALRAEKEHAKAADTAAPSKKAVGTGKTATGTTSRKTASTSVAQEKKPAQKREDMSFAVRMVTSTEPKDEDDIPGMAPAQKIIIVLALIAFVVFIGYSVLTSTGTLH